MGFHLLIEGNKFWSSDQNPRETHRSLMACTLMCWKETPMWMSTWLTWMNGVLSGNQMRPDAPFTSCIFMDWAIKDKHYRRLLLLLTCLLSLSLPSAHWCFYWSSCRLQSFTVHSFSLLSPALFVSLFSAFLSHFLFLLFDKTLNVFFSRLPSLYQYINIYIDFN